MEMTDLRVHDLLRLSSPDAITVVDPPSWFHAALEAAPWVVVRRVTPRSGHIAVGVRGARREERCGAILETSMVRERVAPEDMVAGEMWSTAARREHRVLRALARHAPAFTATGLVWGLAGAAGFELATGAPALGPSSDLDLVIRAAAPLLQEALHGFAREAARADIRVDVLVETPCGGFSLDEFAKETETLLLRTPEGPRLMERTRLLPSRAP